MQNDFVTGALGTKEAQAIVPAVKEKVEKAAIEHTLVIFTRDTHDENYLETQEGKNLPVPHCIQGTKGHEIIDEIMPPFNFRSNIIDKPSFGNINWADLNTGVHEVELIGVCTDICVISNALIIKALYPEMIVTVDATCCAGVTPEKHLAALETMRSCQVNVI